MIHRILTIVLMAAPISWCGAAPPVDLVIENARIWTGDAQRPEAAGMAIHHGRIVALWTSEEKEAIPVAKKRYDAAGRRVVPGFYDSHLHLMGGGRGLSQVALKDAADEQEFGRRLQEFDRKLPRDRWLLGGDWDHDRALKGALPTAALIDKYVADRPVFLRRYDGHMAIVNTRALQLAGINGKTVDPSGGVIYRGSDGKTPTGLLRDNAMDIVERIIPAPGEGEIAEAIRAALQQARAAGLTSAVDMDGSDAATRRKLFALYQRLGQTGELSMRIDLRWPLAEWKQLADLGVMTRFGTERLTIGGVKGFVDGSLGSSTAKMFDPFVNEPGSTGVFVTPPGRLREWISGADRAGLSVAVHAIGDHANAELLNIFAEVTKSNGPRDRRFRIEHAQHLRPSDIPRFKAGNVVASMQPYHIVDDGRWAEGRIGAQRCASSYANRSLLDSGAVLAFGSDWPVAPLDPLLGIDAAVNRRTMDGKNPQGWFPEQKITVAEALTAYTRGSAYAAFHDQERGILAPGYVADLVVLSRDILDPKERDRIGQTHVVATIVGGTFVYEKR